MTLGFDSSPAATGDSHRWQQSSWGAAARELERVSGPSAWSEDRQLVTGIVALGVDREELLLEALYQRDKFERIAGSQAGKQHPLTSIKVDELRLEGTVAGRYLRLLHCSSLRSEFYPGRVPWKSQK